MKKKRIIIGLIYILLFLAVLSVALIIRSNHYSAYLVMNNDGYMINKNSITKNLFGAEMDLDAGKYEAAPFSASDIIYKKSGNYYMGDQKKLINEEFPLFVNDEAALLNLTDSATLIMDDFETAPCYSGLYINNGISFNPDMERAYREEFMLMGLENGLFINTKTMVVSGNFFLDQTIRTNSIIRFMENEIRYYSPEDGTFLPYRIEPVGNATVIVIDDKEYPYYEFLEKLGLYQKDELKDNAKNTPKEQKQNETATPTPLVVASNGSLPAGETNNQGNKDKMQDKNMQEVTEKAPTPDAASASASVPENADDSNSEDEMSGSKPTPVIRDVNDQEQKPAEPAAAAEVPELPEAVPPQSASAGGSEEPAQDQPEEDEGGNKEWNKPVVKLGNFTTTVYSVLSPGMTIENEEFLYRSGVSFSVYEKSKLVMKKAYVASGDVSIAPLKPDTDYHIVVEMEYFNKFNVREKEFITEADVHTKPLADLIPLRLNWTNGDIAYDKLKLNNLSITNAISSTTQKYDSKNNLVNVNTYIETVQYLNRFEVIITSKKDPKVTYTLPVSNKDLADLRSGLQVMYASNGKIASNTEYDYEFVCYDRFGNVLPLEGSIRGESHTCKQPPKAEITTIKNEVKNIELSITVKNLDEAEVVDGSIYFSLFDRDDNPVITTINRKDKDGNTVAANECSEAHALSGNGDTIQFLDLLDYEVYKIRVYCNYNINDNKGIYESASIGDMSFTTMPISSLGFAFFQIEMLEVKDNSATLAISLDAARTDSRLVKLISNLDISFADAKTQDGTGINVYYSKKGTQPVKPSSEVPPNNGSVTLTKEELEFMKSGDGSSDSGGVTYVFHVENLKSFTKYKLKIDAKAQMGTVDNHVDRKINTYFTPDNFMTLKKTPVIDIDAVYASSSFIKLYGVSVNDPDKAVITYPVTISVYDEKNVQVASFDLPSSDKVEVIDVTKLEKEKTYTFRFFATEFNNGTDMTTYRKGYELYYSELSDEGEYLKIKTKEAVSGSIDLVQLNNDKILNKLEYLPGNTSLTCSNTKLSVYLNYRYSSNSQKKATFCIKNANFGDQQWNSFEIGYSSAYSYATPTKFQLYLQDPDKNPSAQPFTTCTVNDLTRGAEAGRWTNLTYFDNNVTLSGTQTIYVVASTTSTAIDCLWGFRFFQAQTCADGHYYADLNTLVNDPRSELGDIPSYKLKIYEDGAWIDTRRQEWVKNEDGTYTLRMYEVAPDKTETLVDSKVYQGEDRVCNTDFFYEVEKGYHNYKFELWAEVYNYEIMLDDETFDTEEDIIGIRTAEDLANVRFGLDKKYYVLNDIEFPYNWNNITNSQTFNGELDFRGHTLKYNSIYNLISTIGFYGSLKNMVFTYVDGWGKDAERKTDRIVTYNYGKISNIMVIRNNGNKDQSYKTDTAGICHTNYESGVIENFVVKFTDPMIVTNYSAGVCVYNRGMIRNGYIYGQPLQMTAENKLTSPDYYTANNIMGGIAAINRQSGTIENVYSLIDLQTREVKSVNDYDFNLAGINDGSIKNSFSAGDVYYGNAIREGYGPAYRNRYTSGMVKNTFYYSEKNYGGTDNRKISKLVLYDSKWYNRIFNQSGSSTSKQFDLEPIQMGYYPQVVWPDFMPAQEFISLPKLSEEDQIDIVDAYVTEQGEDFAKAVITFDNPDKFKITDIKVQWLNTQILSQEEDGKFYRVTVRLTQAPDTKYFSSYDITSFTYTLGFNDMERSVDYTDGKKPSITAEFYKPIVSTTDWNGMKGDYTQNYRLEADLDFQFLSTDIAVMPANVTLSVYDANFYKDAFTGKLDGNNHKIHYIDTGNYGYVIGKLKGTVKNLTIEYIDATKGTGQFKGFIGRMLEGSSVDNVHILGMDAISYEHCGGIAGDVYSASITNSSVHNINITSSAVGNFTQYIGGLVGRHRSAGSNSNYANMVIHNCYVDGVNIEVLSAGDCGGVGGLAGFIRSSAEIYHVYAVNGKINTVYKNAGGLIGAVDTYTNSESSFYMLKDYYVDVDITSITERCGGLIGFSTVSNGELDEYGLVLGSTASSLPNPEEVGRFYGAFNSTGFSFADHKINGYECSVLNGVIQKDSSLLTYEQLTDPTTYDKGGVLYWDSDFIRNDTELSTGILPKLNREDGTAPLPYQNDYKLENDPITVKSVTSSNYSSGNLYVVQIETEHSPDVTITGATFKGLVAADLGDSNEAVVISKTATGTTLKYVLEIEGYYDTYYLTGLTYTIGEAPTVNTQSMYLNVGILPQYLKISNVNEWNTLMSADMYGLKQYNVQITGDLDFTPYHGSAAHGVIVNHIMGTEHTEGKWYTIKGIDMDSKDSFINAAYGNVSYLNFEDINMTKSKAANQELVNSFGIISAVTGDAHDLSFNNVTINSYNSSYVGLIALSYGVNSNITMKGVTIYGDYASTPARLGIGGLIGRLSGAGGVNGVHADNIIVQGRHYVGGIVGIQEDGRYLWDIKVNNAVVYSQNASYHYIGGIVGSANTSSLSNKFGKCMVRNSVVVGNVYVGGISGLGSVTGNSTLKALENDGYYSEVDNSFILGAGYYTGGIAGQGAIQRADVKSSYVYGLYYIGGITGNGSASYVSCTDSTVGSVYDRLSTDTTNTVFTASVNNKMTYYNTLLGKSSDVQANKVYTEANKLLNTLITGGRKTSWSTTNYGGNNNTRIGGISGRSVAVSNAVVANCRIGSFGAVSVGGIISRTEISAYGTWPYRIYSCGVQSSEIYGAEDVGGIVGSHLRANIESCYCSANVTASLRNAGGIVGRMKATYLYSLSETPYICHVYYSGTVKAPDYAAGIVGKMEQNLYNNNQGWLMAGNVVVTNASGNTNYFLNKQLEETGGITKSLVYENSTITYGSNSKKASEYLVMNPSLLLRDDISLVTTTELKLKKTYTDKLIWMTDEGVTNSNYSTKYWNYNGLINNYMPYLTFAPTNNYDRASAVRIMKYQEGYEPDPKVFQKALVDENGLYVYRYETYKGGVPVPGSGAAVVVKSLAKVKTVSDMVPRADFYTVDADRINIDFNSINPEAELTVKANGLIVAESKIDKRTFTLQYDFRTELEITISNGTDKLSYTVWPEDICRNIMTWNADYYYITSNGIEGSRELLKGQYINMYAGHALSADGAVIDIETGNPIRPAGKIGLMEDVTPLNQFEYDGYRIDTFKTYSLVDDVTRDNLRLYVKNGELSAISSKLSVIPDSIILDDYNGSKYCSILASSGMIEDMTDCGLNFPEDFDNSDIQYMTNNLNSTNHLVLVRYYDGAVAGFNYITGEPLEISSPRGAATDLEDVNGFTGRSQNAVMTNFAALYLDAMAFETNLTDIGWAEVNGTNLESGDEVSAADQKVNEEDSVSMYVENSFVLDDGVLVGDKVQNNTSASLTPPAGGKAGEFNALTGQVPSDTGEYASADMLDDSTAASEELTQAAKQDIAAINAAIQVVATYGATEQDMNQILALINSLKQEGVPEAVISELKKALTEAAKKAAETLDPDPSDTDLSQEDASVSKDKSDAGEAKDSDQKNTSGSSKDTVNSDTSNDSNSKTNHQKKESGQDETSGVKSKDTARYIPVYQTEDSKYVIYDEKDLLTKEDDKLETVNQKVEKSGHMIDYKAKQRVDVEQPDDENIYGYILLSVAIVGIALLLSLLIFKKHKEEV